MFFKELFDKDKVNCPVWLERTFIDDEWNDSKYSYEDKVHVWTFKNELKNLKITFNGSVCYFQAFNKKGELMLEEIYTKTEHSIS